MNLENDFNQENENIQEEVEPKVFENEAENEVHVLENEEEVEQEVQENEEEIDFQVQEVQSNLELQSEVFVDYKQDFLILENIGYFQLFFTGTLAIFFTLWLVYKFFRSFF